MESENYKHDSSHVGHIAFVILAFLIGGIIGYAVGQDWQSAKNTEDNASVSTTKTSSITDTPDWTKYSNTKYNYTFKYPSTIKMVGSSENGTTELTLTPSVDGVKVFPISKTSADSVFLVSAPGIVFTPTAIKLYYGEAISQTVILESVKLNSVSAYKATVPNDTLTYYFVKNSAGTVLKISYLSSSEDAKNILSTFKII